MSRRELEFRVYIWWSGVFSCGKENTCKQNLEEWLQRGRLSVWNLVCYVATIQLWFSIAFLVRNSDWPFLIYALHFPTSRLLIKVYYIFIMSFSYVQVQILVLFWDRTLISHLEIYFLFSLLPIATAFSISFLLFLHIMHSWKLVKKNKGTRSQITGLFHFCAKNIRNGHI